MTAEVDSSRRRDVHRKQQRGRGVKHDRLVMKSVRSNVCHQGPCVASPCALKKTEVAQVQRRKQRKSRFIVGVDIRHLE